MLIPYLPAFLLYRYIKRGSDELGDVALQVLQLRCGHAVIEGFGALEGRGGAGDELRQAALGVSADLLQQPVALHVSRTGQGEVRNATRVPGILQMVGHHATEGAEQAARELCAVQLVHGVHDAQRGGPDGVLVEHAAEQLAVAEDHLVLHVLLPKGVTGRLGLGVQVQRGQRRAAQVGEQASDYLLAGPHAARLEDGGLGHDHGLHRSDDLSAGQS